MTVNNMLPESPNIRYADLDRSSKYEQLVSLQRDVATVQAESNSFAGVSSANVPLNIKQDLRKRQNELAKFVRKLQKEHSDIAARWTSYHL